MGDFIGTPYRNCTRLEVFHYVMGSKRGMCLCGYQTGCELAATVERAQLEMHYTYSSPVPSSIIEMSFSPTTLIEVDDSIQFCTLNG